MDWRTFISELVKAWFTGVAEVVKAIAWPLAVVVIILLLRRRLDRLIPLLKRLKYGDFEAEFSKELEVAQQEAAKLPAPLVRAVEESESARETIERLMSLAEALPDVAILEAWSALEAAIRRAAQRLQLSIPLNARIRTIISKLRDERLLRPEMARLFTALFNIRNLLVHSPSDRSVSPNEAKEFISMVATLLNYFESLPRIQNEAGGSDGS